ncbi:MAG TPA: hypothetical protein VK174_06290 [Chitinophagales bacterium]|nr:hypothetical protein [Chitinophagales bacterium]
MKRTALLLSATIIIATLTLALQTDKSVMEKNGIKLSPAPATTDFPNAGLSLKSPSPGAAKAGIDTFKFDVTNYTLGAQTPDADQVMCANSAKGQHIHFIWDNAPYAASYSPNFAQDVKPGHHVLLAFLSRSYHESIKHPGAYILKEFSVGPDAKDNFNEKAPHIFASRPKGEYIGEKEVKRVMLDFYMLNCTLSPKGYKVRATINGTEFILTKWQPYMIEGLALGANKIKLELLNKNNKPVNSPYNGTERTITLKTDPLK